MVVNPKCAENAAGALAELALDPTSRSAIADQCGVVGAVAACANEDEKPAAQSLRRVRAKQMAQSK